MSLAIVHSRAQVGVEAPCVSVEAHLANGLPSLTLVGLPETAVRESKDRVRSALLNAGFDFPARRITLNLAPADLPKDGGRFDLAIALGILSKKLRYLRMGFAFDTISSFLRMECVDGSSPDLPQTAPSGRPLAHCEPQVFSTEGIKH